MMTTNETFDRMDKNGEQTENKTEEQRIFNKSKTQKKNTQTMN